MNGASSDTTPSPPPGSPTSLTDSAFLIPLQDVVFGDVRSSAKREEDSLSVETALEDGQRWEDERFWEEYAQPLDEKEDTQPVLKEELKFRELAPYGKECCSYIYAGCV